MAELGDMTGVRGRSARTSTRYIALVIGAALITSLLPMSAASAEHTVAAKGKHAWPKVCREGKGRVFLDPGDNIQQRINRHGAGSTYCLRAGVHRIQQPLGNLQRGDKFVGQQRRRTVLSGAKRITNWKKIGTVWMASNQKQRNPLGGSAPCKPEGSRQCQFPEDVFLDHRRLKHVGSVAAVGKGEFYFDHKADKIYIGNDPKGRLVEGAAAAGAFRNQGANILIRNLVIEKYANHAGAFGAVFARQVEGWRIINNTIRLNHGKGIGAGKAKRIKILNNRVNNNGQMGIGGGPDFSVVAGNHVVNNNTLDFQVGWEAGGVKFGDVHGSVFRNNVIRKNAGFGLWCDVGCVDVIYAGNRVSGNTHGGIHHEISGPAIIRNNFVKNNGTVGSEASKAGIGRASGILVVASQNVRVHHNRVVGNGNGITAISSGRGNIKNLKVFANVMIMKGDQRTGLWGNGPYSGAGNRWSANTYQVCRFGVDRYKWSNGLLGFGGWRQHGHDVEGKLVKAKNCVRPD